MTSCQLFHQLYVTGTMSIPSPVATAREFLDYIKSLELPSAISAFTHCQNWPQSSLNGCFNDGSTALWYNWMDVLTVSYDTSFNITNVVIDD